MIEYLNYLYVICGVLLLFGAAVFVHEFGHYWVARKRGLKVEAFAIGFGPKIFGWTKDGIEYSVRWIPAGGFVKLPQMITSEALEGGTSASSDPIPPASPWDKILVALAGPFMNVVFAFAIAVVIYFVGLPVAVNLPIVGLVPPDSEEAKLGIRQGDVIVAMEGKKVETWQDVVLATVFARTNVVSVVINRNGELTTYRLKTQSDNPAGLKMLNLEPKEHVVVGSVERGSAAADAKVLPSDVIVSFASIPIVSREQLSEIVNKCADKPSEIVIERKGERLTLSVTPRMDQKLDPPRARIGISFATKYVEQKPGPTPWAQIADVWDKTVSTLGALFHSKQTGVGIKDLSGPPGILAMLSIQLNTDYRLALSFLVLLNINLAIINLFPIPVLDGGHILMALIERIFRRPINVRVVEWTTTAFAILLISFMLYVSYNDIFKRSGHFKSMFQSETKIEQATPASPAPNKP
jgi:regulator of sigma E protease